jgi:hypothetical protein
VIEFPPLGALLTFAVQHPPAGGPCGLALFLVGRCALSPPQEEEEGEGEDGGNGKDDTEGYGDTVGVRLDCGDRRDGTDWMISVVQMTGKELMNVANILSSIS